MKTFIHEDCKLEPRGVKLSFFSQTRTQLIGYSNSRFSYNIHLLRA